MTKDGVPVTQARLRRIGLACAVAVLAVQPALADPLPPGSVQWKTHATEPELPKYTVGLPSYFTAANKVTTLTAPMTRDFTGTVTTDVYRDPTTGFLSFQYTFANTDTRDFIVRATMNGWEGIGILDAGADGSGTSGNLDPAPEWTDGDPRFISRDPTTEGLMIQWRFNTGRDLIGTVVGPGNTSSRIWFATDQKNYTLGQVDYIDTAASGESDVLVPVPAPAAAVLGLLGMLFVGQARRWGWVRNLRAF